ncbi:MAG: ankyrin repeat domain-containing protein [Rickettsiales bacterium]|nr:ankyrin repeat domain-containing protein [Rickettsiales bacterium]
MKTLIIVENSILDNADSNLTSFRKHYAQELAREDVIVVGTSSIQDFKDALDAHQGEFDQVVIQTHGGKGDIPTMFFGEEWSQNLDVSDVVKIINSSAHGFIKRIDLASCFVGNNFDKICRKARDTRYYQNLKESLQEGQVLYMHGDEYTGSTNKSYGKRLIGIIERNYDIAEAILDSVESLNVVIKKKGILQSFDHQPFGRLKGHTFDDKSLLRHLTYVGKRAIEFQKDFGIPINDAYKRKFQELSSSPQYRHQYMANRFILDCVKEQDGDSFSMIENMINQGANVNYQDDDGWTALMYGTGETKYSLYLLFRGADPNLTDKNGWTALMLSSAHGKIAHVKNLVQNKNTNLDCVDNSGRGALVFAIEQGHEDIAFLLLEAGANPNIVDREGYTPLMFAIDKNSRNDLIVKLIEKSNIDTINAVAQSMDLLRKRSTALLLAIHHSSVDIVKKMLERGADPNIRNDWGNNALIEAAIHGQFENLLAILESNVVDIDAQNSFGTTALLESIECYDHFKVQILLDRGANPNIATSTGFTPLMSAVRSGDINMVAYLLLHGANLKNIDDRGRTAADYARDLNFTEIVNLLHEDSVLISKEDKDQDIDTSNPTMTDSKVVDLNMEIDVSENSEIPITIEDQKKELFGHQNLRGGSKTDNSIDYAVYVFLVAFVMYCAKKFAAKEKKDDDVDVDIEAAPMTRTSVRDSALAKRERANPNSLKF